MAKRRRRSRKAAGKRRIRPPKVKFEFTDLDLTAFGGASILAQTARRLRVEADNPIRVMSLLESPTGHLANLSAGIEPWGEDADP